MKTQEHDPLASAKPLFCAACHKQDSVVNGICLECGAGIMGDLVIDARLPYPDFPKVPRAEFMPAGKRTHGQLAPAPISDKPLEHSVAPDLNDVKKPMIRTVQNG